MSSIKFHPTNSSGFSCCFPDLWPARSELLLPGFSSEIEFMKEESKSKQMDDHLFWEPGLAALSARLCGFAPRPQILTTPLLGRWVRNQRWRGGDLSLLLEKQPQTQAGPNLHLQAGPLISAPDLFIQLPTWPPLGVLIRPTDSVYLNQISSALKSFLPSITIATPSFFHLFLHNLFFIPL